MKLKNPINEPKEWLNFDDLINSDNLYALCICFFNLTNENESYFIIESSYRKSKFTKVILTEEMFKQNNKLISEISSLPFILEKNKHRCYIAKTSKVNTSKIFLNELYKQIQQLRQYHSDEEFSKIICSSLFFPRGSIDFNANFFSVDLYRRYLNEEYLTKIFHLLTSIGDTRLLNFNFRELQKQFVTKTNTRYTQIRINLKWVSENLFSILEKFNEYKYKILDENLNKFKAKSHRLKKEDNFYYRIQFYIKNVLNSKNNDLNIENLRKKLKLNIEKNENIRNASLIALAKTVLPDFCAGCKDIYNLKDRTFKYKNSDQWYLEINHVISFANNNVDQLDNLCKLCPACHKALTPNRTDEKLQKKIIASILKYTPATANYVSLFFEENSSLDEKIEYIFEKLK